MKLWRALVSFCSKCCHRSHPFTDLYKYSKYLETRKLRIYRILLPFHGVRSCSSFDQLCPGWVCGQIICLPVVGQTGWVLDRIRAYRKPRQDRSSKAREAEQQQSRRPCSGVILNQLLLSLAVSLWCWQHWGHRVCKWKQTACTIPQLVISVYLPILSLKRRVGSWCFTQVLGTIKQTVKKGPNHTKLLRAWDQK